jgi:hypothetical protein
MQFLKQVLVQDESQAASAVRTDDLPVNPLSHISITMRALNDTGTLTDFTVLSALLGFITKVEVLFQGSAIISGSLDDLARLQGVLLGRGPMAPEITSVTNQIRGVTVIIPLGRKPFMPDECFPAVRRGELRLQITSGAATTGIDTVTLQIETVELLGASPKQYMKSTTISKTPSATGDHEVDLPIGNTIAGALLFGTTVPTGAAWTASINQIRLLVDNVEAYYGNTNWETLHGEMAMRCQANSQQSEHVHVSDVGAAYTQWQDTDLNAVNTDFYNSYGYLDLDPRGDDNFLLDTKGRARVHTKINAGAADAIRIMPVELVPVAG